jgi:hypothetical protein
MECLRNSGFGFLDSGFWFWVSDFESNVQGFGSGLPGLGFRVSGFKSVSGLGLVLGLRFRIRVSLFWPHRHAVWKLFSGFGFLASGGFRDLKFGLILGFESWDGFGFRDSGWL